jgi:hypothetical protein
VACPQLVSWSATTYPLQFHSGPILASLRTSHATVLQPHWLLPAATRFKFLPAQPGPYFKACIFAVPWTQNALTPELSKFVSFSHQSDVNPKSLQSEKIKISPRLGKYTPNLQMVQFKIFQLYNGGKIICIQ